MELRPYQKKSINDAVKYLDSDSKSPSIIVLGTGAGKTWVTAEIAKYLISRGEKVLISVPSQELLEQSYSKYIEIGGEASLYSASVGKKDIGAVTFATAGSLKGKGKLFKELGIKYLLVDECHFLLNPKASNVLNTFLKELSPKKVLGLTATPFYLKSTKTGSELVMINRSFPRIFEKIIHLTQIQELVVGDYWAKLGYTVYPFDSSALELNKGGTEFTEESILLANSTQGVNNRMYKVAKSLISEGIKSILIFTDSVENAITMANALPGFKCIHANTPKRERKEIIRAFKAGELNGLSNVSTLTLGFDSPNISNILDGSSTMSLSLYYQKLGRGVRKSETKKNCTIHDFCGNYHRFGRIEDLVIEYYKDYGWGVFSEDRLLTGVPLQGLTVRKSDLDNIVWQNPKSDMKISFGVKYKDKFVHQVPYNIREFWLEKWDFTTDNMIQLKLEMERLNKIEAMNKLTTKKRTY